MTASDVLARTYALIEAELDAKAPGWDTSNALIAKARAISVGYTGVDRFAADAPAKGSKGKRPSAARRHPSKTGPQSDNATPINLAGPPAPTPTLDAPARASYLAYFAPRALAALDAATFGTTFDAPVVDIGAGTGAAALWAATRGAKDIRLVDHAPQALASAATLLRRAKISDAKVIERSIDTAKVLEGSVVVSAFTLGESILSRTLKSGDDEDAGLNQWLDLLAPAREALLVDAGDRSHGRVIQRLRALAIERGMVVKGPCPHQDVCPALAREKDWCHHRAPRSLSPRLAAFARAVGRDDEWVSFSSLHLIPNPTATDRHAAEAKRGLLILADPLEEKGRVRVPACGPDGIRFVQVKKRDRSLWQAMKKVDVGERWNALSASDIRDQTLHLEGTDENEWLDARVPPKRGP